MGETGGIKNIQNEKEWREPRITGKPEMDGMAPKQERAEADVQRMKAEGKRMRQSEREEGALATNG